MPKSKEQILRELQAAGLKIPIIYMPNKSVDLHSWSTVACDQYTSEPEYWEDVRRIVGDKPSALQLIYPEVYLHEPDAEKRIQQINRTMQEYLNSGILEAADESFYLVRRKPAGAAERWGLIAALDLEQYDYAENSTSLVRATEGTILERIPPRKHIRENAPLELPHILVLIDDYREEIIEPLKRSADSLEKVYDFELMKNGGHITGYKVGRIEDIERIVSGLKKLADPELFHRRYDADHVLLYALGDGNHSLAAAKSCWEDIKRRHSDDPNIMDHPARWALVEIENIHDPGLIFEPIHRALLHADRNLFENFLSEACSRFTYTACASIEEIQDGLADQSTQKFGYVDSSSCGIYELSDPSSSIAAGTVQKALDSLLREEKSASIDYIHGLSVTERIARKPGNFGILLPAIDKNSFFRTIVHDGALPRKTFSMGEAHEKRFYLETRKIIR